MSQSKSAEPDAHYWKPCALEMGGWLFGGRGLGIQTAIQTVLHVHREPEATSWQGFTIEIPLGERNEDDGFGVTHKYDRRHIKTITADHYSIEVHFPHGSQFIINELSEDTLAKLPDTKKKMSWLEVHLKERPTVKGFGMPFANPGHPSEGFVNRNAAIKGKTLLDILQQESFYFIVAAPKGPLEKYWAQELPAPFRYPYGQQHFWDEGRYDEILPETRGKQFPPAMSFDDDNEHMAALTQSQVQDIMWVHKAALEIAEIPLRGYFVPAKDGPIEECNFFYAIVPLDKAFLDKYEDAWRRLTKHPLLNLKVWEKEDDQVAVEWTARIQEASRGIDVLDCHPLDINDLVLHVRKPREEDLKCDFIPVKNCVSLEFPDQVADFKLKVNATWEFRPNAGPSNPVACGMPKEKKDGESERVPIPEDVKFRMALHRALLRGNGFYDVLVQSADEVDELAENLATADLDVGVTEKGNLLLPKRLPVIDLINLPDEHLKALMEEALPADRQRFVKYLSERPLGLGAITAGPGFGKTTALAIGTLAMAATLGQIYGTAPTHVATDNFAERLDRITKSVTRRRNQGKADGDSARARRALVVRGYLLSEEFTAFHNILRDPRMGEKVAASRKWKPDAHWKLHLSPSYWLLKALRFRDHEMVSPLHEDDPVAIFGLQAYVDKTPRYQGLRDVATGAISWAEYEKEKLEPQFVETLMAGVYRNAHILCTTPSQSCKMLFKEWKEEKAKGIAVDEAGNINRPDLYRVWGNTLLPCLMGGDDLQLPPTVMTMDEKDAEGNHLNRLGKDGKISALEFLRTSGWPIYRLKTQLRMAKGLFDTCHREVYSDVPFNYGGQSDLSNHATGVQLEKYLKGRFPNLTAPPAGSLSEVFVHCQGTECIVDEATHSKRNPDQVANALDFLADMVRTGRFNPRDFAIITPYAANVGLTERRREKPEYAILSAMPPAATVDSFQGREADIMVAIMGTTEEVGPGFTTDAHRLNVMLSRQRSGLLVFGDINVMGTPEPAPEPGSGRGSRGNRGDRGGRGCRGNRGGRVGRGGGKNFVVENNGVRKVVREGMLHKVLNGWKTSGRVVTLPPRPKRKPKATAVSSQQARAEVGPSRQAQAEAGPSRQAKAEAGPSSQEKFVADW
ncbi:Regulator of nonsense transcripts 1 [Trichoderma ghanense]|uniref:Regulator of nonsense transcripts 1 n=1 Tax=Trichoderma ghanense TaxID=65468 RepID=A0ABY2H622_9HYPO